MKKIASLLLALGLMSGLSAHAVGKNPADWECSLQFEAKGRGLQVIIGHFKMEGKGLLSCHNDAGETQEIPMKVTMGGKFFQPQVAAGWLTVKGLAKGVGINQTPSSLAGKYYVANAAVAVIGGVGATAGFDVNKDDNVAFQMSLQVTKGFGIALGIERMELEVAN